MIPVFKPYYDERELSALKATLDSGWVGLGPRTKEFEDKFAEYVGAKYCVGLNSCTAALHLACEVMNVKGGEVITSPMTFVSSNHAIIYAGGTPVFCDIEEDTLNIDPAKIEGLITPKTKAIMCVHYGGYACDMERINEIAQKHNLVVIEDAAHASGGEWNEKKLGSIGDISCFSFHAVKNLAMGEGGAICTNDEEIYKKLMRLRWMGITKDTWSRAEGKSYSWYYDVVEFGYKYHLSDIAAAIGLIQLEKLDKANARRRELVNQYNDLLSGVEELDRPVRKPYQTLPAAHNYVIQTEHRDGLHEYLKSKDISTGVHYIPSNHYELYKTYTGETPVSERVWKRLLTLPLYPDLKNEQLAMIVDEIKAFYREHAA